jgi:hypothetical protein
MASRTLLASPQCPPEAGNFDALSHAILNAPTDIHPVDDRLQRLQDLHAAGMLSDDEFETQRLRILGT